jgi:hypothetical protein
MASDLYLKSKSYTQHGTFLLREDGGLDVEFVLERPIW